MTLATLQQLRTFEFDNHPIDLEEGQLAFNLAVGNFNVGQSDYNIYMYVGNGSDGRIDETGTTLVAGGTSGKGWIRFRLRNVSVDGDSVYGNLNVINSNLRIFKQGPTGSAELLIPTELDTSSMGALPGSLRWNTQHSILQSWNGTKWDTASKVSVSTTAPANPSNGDMWFNPSGSGTFYIFVVPNSGPATWAVASSGAAATALQPGNGVSANIDNEIDTIDPGLF